MASLKTIEKFLLVRSCNFVRSRTDNNCFTSDAANASANITLEKLDLCVPYVDIVPLQRLNIYKILERGRKIMVEYRTKKLYEYPNISVVSTFNWQI